MQISADPKVMVYAICRREEVVYRVSFMVLLKKKLCVNYVYFFKTMMVCHCPCIFLLQANINLFVFN